jgi:hypothetical protein
MSGACCPGDGAAAGICIPGVITWPGLGDGDAGGICIPGVITGGHGEGEGFAVPRLVVCRARVVVFLFGVARFGFGVVAFGLGITCPSCCGKALPLSANTIASAQNALSVLFFLTEQFIFPPGLLKY